MSYYRPDAKAYMQYYTGQAGGGRIAKFHGSQYGYGLGGILRSIIRKIIPLGKTVAKRAFSVAKPHLKAAAKDLVGEGVRMASNKLSQQFDNKQRGGKRKRKSTTSLSKPKNKKAKKARKTKKSKTVKKRRRTSRRRYPGPAAAQAVLNSMPDIF